MKNVIIISLIFFLFSNVYCQRETQEEISRKLNRSLSMKRTGQGLTFVGGIVTVGGFALIINGINSHNNHLFPTEEQKAQNESADNKIIAGYFLAILGEAALGTGIALWIVGGVKSKRYKRLLNNYPKSLSLGVDQKGVGLHFHF